MSTISLIHKSFLISIDTRADGSTITAVEPRVGEPKPEDYFLGCLGALAAVYVAASEGTDDDLTPEEFVSLVSAKLRARLEDYEASRTSKPSLLQ